MYWGAHVKFWRTTQVRDLREGIYLSIYLSRRRSGARGGDVGF